MDPERGRIGRKQASATGQFDDKEELTST